MTKTMGSVRIEPEPRAASENATSDPLGCGVELPFSTTLHPVGYPVTFRSNSAEPLEIADRLWGGYPQLSQSDAVQFRIIVDDDEGPAAVPSPPRGQDHLVTIVHGPRDFAVVDLSRGFAFAVLSRRTIARREYFQYYFLEPMVYLMQAAKHFVLVHASCISREGKAIVLCGDSGAGKTCLAYGCAKRGWSFVTGDALHIVRHAGVQKVIGRPFEIRFRESARELFPELHDFALEYRPTGKADLAIDTVRLNLSLELTAVAHSVVFIERTRRQYLVRCGPDYALERLGQTICYGDESTRHDQLAALRRFVSLPLWRLGYSDPKEAELLLAGLMDTEP